MHRVSIEGKSPYKESYTVNSHWKMSYYVFSDVRALREISKLKIVHVVSLFSHYMSIMQLDK